jgi:hypothetical protein
VSVGPTVDRRALELDTAATKKKESEVKLSTLIAKEQLGEFDVFIAHAGTDKDFAQELATQLKKRSLRPWIDLWEIAPGDSFLDKIGEALPKIKAVAILVGPSGIGPWQHEEVKIAIQNFVTKKAKVIPILLGKMERPLELPVWLGQFSRVQMESGPADKNKLDDLEFGITGVHPARQF